jgi:hypothetical protein
MLMRKTTKETQLFELNIDRSIEDHKCGNVVLFDYRVSFYVSLSLFLPLDGSRSG